MSEDFETGRVIEGECTEVMSELPESSIHAVVTDPPYNFDGGFMGKEWDNVGEPKQYQKWCESWAREVKRVLKPGGHLLAFSGNRTHHRAFSGIEDAGFEIRDTITWHYAEGFPKALDVHDHIYKHQSPCPNQEADFAWRKTLKKINSKSASSVDKSLRKKITKAGTSTKKENSVVGDVQPVTRVKKLQSNATTAEQQSNARRHTSTKTGQTTVVLTAAPEMEQSLLSVETAEMSLGNRSQTQSTPKRASGTTLFIVRVNVKRMVSQMTTTNHKGGGVPLTESGVRKFLNATDSSANFAEALRILKRTISNQLKNDPTLGTTFQTENASATNVIITKSTAEHLITSTVAMRKGKPWSGWKTHLNPATEYVVVARAPLSEGTVAENVMEHGTGALNIGASRIGTEEDLSFSTTDPKDEALYGNGRTKGKGQNPEGRYPSNVVFDEAAARTLDEDVGELDGGSYPSSDAAKNCYGDWGGTEWKPRDFDSGGASRYFYTSKASKSERNLGLPDDEQNEHPTVKPVDLMRWLVQLVTREGQVVLDPFVGSGTTAIAADFLGREYIGVEQDEEHAELARRRVENYDAAELSEWIDDETVTEAEQATLGDISSD